MSWTDLKKKARVNDESLSGPLSPVGTNEMQMMRQERRHTLSNRNPVTPWLRGLTAKPNNLSSIPGLSDSHKLPVDLCQHHTMERTPFPQMNRLEK